MTRGTFLLGVYAIGLGLPFLISALFIERAMGVMNRLKRHMKWIERADWRPPNISLSQCHAASFDGDIVKPTGDDD